MVRDFFSKLLRREISSFVRISVTVAPLYPGRRKAIRPWPFDLVSSRRRSRRHTPHRDHEIRPAMWLGANLARLRSVTTRCYASTNRRSRQATYPAVCSKRATLLDNVHLANRKAEVRAELTKRLDVKGSDVRARGHDRNTAPEIFWIDGRRTRPLRRRHSGKGRAVPERLPVDP